MLFEKLVQNLYYWCMYPLGPLSSSTYFEFPAKNVLRKLHFATYERETRLARALSNALVRQSSCPPVLQSSRSPPPPTHIITLCLMPTVQKNFTRRQRQQSTYSKCKSKVKKFQFHLIIIFHSISLYYDESGARE